MTQYVINIGAIPNDGTGDPLRTAFNEVNLNFNQVWATGLVGSNLAVTNTTIRTTNTNGDLVLAPNGVGVVTANAHVVPDQNRIRNLGSPTRYWDTVYTQYATIAGDLTVNGNLSVTGNIIEVGNIVTDAKTIQLANTASTANAANGSGITVGANDNIATLLYNSTSNAWTTNTGISSVGNITAPYFFGNGSQLTGLAATYGNANVATFLAGFGSNAISTTGNITSGNVLTAGVVSAVGNVRGANFNTVGAVSATGNVTGNYFIGNGSQLTSLPAPTVTQDITSNGAMSIMTYDGNIKYVSYATVEPSSGNITGGNISAVGNITGNYFIGNGSLLTGISTSSNKIFNGNSYANIATADGNLVVSADGNTWTFGTDGNLTIPGNAWIHTPAGTNGNINFYPDGGGAVVIRGATPILLNLVSDSPDVLNRIEIDTFGISNVLGGTFTGTFTRGNLTNPEAVQAGDRLTSLKGKGFDGVSLSYPTGQMTIDAFDNWSSGNTPTRLSFWTTGYACATPILNMQIDPDGNVSVFNGNITVAGGGYLFGDANTGNSGLFAGVPGFTTLGSNVVAQFAGNANSYSQINFQNISPGNVASGDIIITADNGTDGTYFIDMGIASSTYDFPGFSIIGPNDGYLFVAGVDQTGPTTGTSNLNIGSTDGNIRSWIGGGDTGNIITTVHAGGFEVAGNISTAGSGGNISATGNITGGNLITSGLGGNITMTGGNITGANVISANAVSTAGNITAANFFGNTRSQTILPTIQSIVISNTSSEYELGGGQGYANVSVANVIPVTEYGVIVTSGSSVDKYVTGNLGNIPGTEQILISTGTTDQPFTVYAYVTTNAGTYYSGSAVGFSGLCLLKGTIISLADGTYKAIEDIDNDDLLLTWDFDLGRYAQAQPLWIKRGETGTRYNQLTFSDGTILRTFDQHRIFNKQAGAFTYPMSDDTPIGTITVNEHGQEITLVKRDIVWDTIEHYNIITDHHINLFADSILTSCRFNNIYPIVDMKFVKDAVLNRSLSEFVDIDSRFVSGLRLQEQSFELAMIKGYVLRLLATEATESIGV